ncbi:two-component system, OmpR family, phosphate regulon sensor histidine kinase PhoR [Alkalispirochaeta americana]|uniref:histidine kinase n=1 Tax=Alkalispirochaeta americana TaxID=159291 RepID=A0A1N6U6E4_9SPIO|nr:HAMP domain-containing histidine kinase [Alkalispirochaeta americana]SIQ61150.1 two-component system, OmpR family, phosphate regulon sensor histidine kinase PhoR [Alkalispirochaeta americana]
MRRSLFFYIYPAYLIAIVIAFGALSLIAASMFRSVLYQEKLHELHTIATLAENAIPTPFTDQDQLRRFLQGTTVRLTIIAHDGDVLAESRKDPEILENHRDRQEIIAALQGKKGVSLRRSDTTGERTLYVALPSPEPSQPIFRAAASLAQLDHRLREIIAILIPAVAGVLVVTAIITALIINRAQKPLRRIQEGARHFSRGNLTHRIEVRGPEEVSLVAAALNGMAERLAGTIHRIEDQRNESEAVLTSMVEGVILVDANKEIRSMNIASQKLFRKEGIPCRGMSLLEHLQNPALDHFAGDVLKTGGYAEATITLGKAPPVHVQVHGTLLRRQDDRGPRVLLVLNDITRLKQLEAMRRDFVANVSHELKTPVTAILGFVETLLDEVPDGADHTQQFLNIIGKHANRLNLIIEDLLALSRLESQEGMIDPARFSLERIIERVFEGYRDQARRKDIHLRVHYDGHAQACGAANLLEQALNNLVENAIKYSEPGGEVAIIVENRNKEIRIQVKDTGQGIPQEDVPRIFERFFRVDRARSRELGGTGLGLAIVKHIVLAHQGEIMVDTREGSGSTFTLRIPQDQ